jgi:aquaporin Z
MAEESVAPKLIAEFVGTYLLVFTVGCNVLSGSPAWIGTSIGCVLMVSIYALGGVSGANFNPAVSVALGLSNKMEWKDVGMYCAVQIIAGIVAALSYGALFFKVFNLAPAPGFGWWEAGLAEVLYTFMLCFVVLNTAASTTNNPKADPNQFYGIAIGFVIIAGAYGAGAISGGCFNPAVALGIDVSSAGLGFGWGPAYAGYELLGAALAAGAFRVVRPEDFDDSLKAKPQTYTLPTRLFSEFLGTFFLVLTVGLNVLGKSAGPVWSIAASLMCMIYALGNCSGAHFNPAVTLALLASGRDIIPATEALAYMGIQILGGICASFTYAAMHHGATFALAPGKGFNFGHAAMAEIVFTFVLCYVVLCVASVKKTPASKDMFGLAIASCVTAGGYAIGAVSGGSLNPAVSFGISSSNIINHGLFYNCLIYSAYEFIGAGLAAGVFRATHPGEFLK